MAQKGVLALYSLFCTYRDIHEHNYFITRMHKLY